MSAYDSLPRFDSLASTPAPRYLVEDLIVEGTLTFLAGLPGVGKSLIAQSLAASIASGQDWFDRAALSGRVIYATTDASARLTFNRFQAWESLNGIPIPYENLRYLERLDLSNAALSKPLIDLAAEGVRVLIIDVLASLIGGMNLNEQSQVMALHTLFRSLFEASNGELSIIVLAHSPKSAIGPGSSISGSVQLEAMADHVLIASKTSTGLKLTVKKNRHGSEGLELPFSIEAELDSAVLQGPKLLQIGLEEQSKALAVLELDWQSSANWIRRSKLPETSARRVLEALLSRGLAELRRDGRSVSVRLPPAPPTVLQEQFGGLNTDLHQIPTPIRVGLEEYPQISTNEEDETF
jgi:hypothetical protein